MRYKVCRKSNCSTLIPYGQVNPYCTKHADYYKQFTKDSIRNRQQNYRDYNHHQRDKEANKFYQSKLWSILSRQLKHEAYFTCQCCGRTYDKPGYLVTDHIVPRRVDKRKQLDKNNLWVICKRCHYWKGVLESKIYQSKSLIENLDTTKKWNQEQIIEWILERENKSN